MKIKVSQGFSLIEVLIAFVILVVGLLGATTLIIRSSQVNVNAYETEQVAMLSNTMVERIRANPNGINSYINKSTSTVECDNKSSNCDFNARAGADNVYFQNQFEKNLNINDVDWTLLEKGGSTTVTGSNAKLYQLKITWGADTNGVSGKSYYLNFVL
ncbi:type IV pilus modification protein PilV [Entomomonas moraniae]|nr:type IV pilus modification protein PilV [Entomomonas moraniae]